ncbi:MAG: hypothetical protein KAJ07_02445 [Planctomycetes bacterium]|nr:hypothetical protein [Planctomycetota bacterium]
MFDNKRPLHVIFLFSLIVCSQLYAIETDSIDQVLKKDVAGQMLDDYDRRAVADFWTHAIEEMLITADLDEIVEIKSLMLLKKPQTMDGDYYDAYTQAAKETITATIKEVNAWDNEELREHIKINLLILVAQLKSPELMDFAFQGLDAPDAIVRYWSVKAITSDVSVERLNSEIVADEATAQKILNAVENVVENEKSGEILELAINFLVQVNTDDAKQIISKLVDTRIEAYKSWNLTCEMMDSKLLMSLGSDILTETKTENKAQITRKFAQLYSYVIQRYIIGKNLLSQTQKQNLASVMVNIEKNMIGKLLEKPQSSIKRAIEKRSIASLKREHDTLLGTSSLAGELARKIEFDYGKKTTGRAINAPMTLPNPPEPDSEI